MYLTHSKPSPTLPCPRKSCLPSIRSLVAKRLRTAGLESRGFTGTVHAQLLQSCLTLRDPMDCSPPGSSSPWGFSRQEYWSGLPCPPPGNPADQGIKPASLMSPALAGGFFTTSATEEAAYGLQKETKLRRFQDYGLSGGTGGLGGPHKSSWQQGPEEAVDTAGHA